MRDAPGADAGALLARGAELHDEIHREVDRSRFATSTSPTSFGFPGATPVVSSNGTSNGIVWAIEASQYGPPAPGPGPAVLYAYDAGNVTIEYWNSSMVADQRDQAGPAVKFVPPTIANGKVYVSTRTEIDVYGLLP